MSNLWDVNQCAAFLGVSPATVYKWAHRGKIPHRKFGGVLRFSPTEIDLWTRQRASDTQAPQPASRFQAARERVRSLTTEHIAVPPVQKRTG